MNTELDILLGFGLPAIFGFFYVRIASYRSNGLLVILTTLWLFWFVVFFKALGFLGCSKEGLLSFLIFSAVWLVLAFSAFQNKYEKLSKFASRLAYPDL